MHFDLNSAGINGPVKLAAHQKLIRNPGLLSLLEIKALLQGVEETEQAVQAAQGRSHHDGAALLLRLVTFRLRDLAQLVPWLEVSPLNSA